jgi:hypothetical protein
MVRRIPLAGAVAIVLLGFATPALAHTQRVNDHVRVVDKTGHLHEVVGAVRALDYPWERLEDQLQRRWEEGKTRAGPMITVVVHNDCCHKQPHRYEDMETAGYVAPGYTSDLAHVVQPELGHAIDYVLEGHRERLLRAHERDSWYASHRPWAQRPMEQFANQAIIEWGSARARRMRTWDSELFVRAATQRRGEDADAGAADRQGPGAQGRYLMRINQPLRVGIPDPGR